MPRDTLRDLFTQLAAIHGEFLVHDDGFRRHRRSYADTARAARVFARRLADVGVRQGDRVLIWGENRPEWIVALWGALISGVVVVPIDYRSSRPFVERVAAIVRASVWIVGDDLPPASAGDEDGAAGHATWKLSDISWSGDAAMPDVAIGSRDTAEVIFTSGATADPKGVVLTHRNILANIEPIDREIDRFRAYGRPFSPIRILNLLPMSHMFGQTMAAFVPPLLRGTTCFISSYNPPEIVRTIRTLRVSVLACVPRMLDLLRAHVTHAAGSARDLAPPRMHWTRRWWRHFDAHRLFGLKFWCAVVGAAPLDPELEAFWSRLGFVIIQGYGLTETAPVVTLNHPLAASKGSVGRPVEGVEVKLAPDGEILVRGDNVSRGYYNDPAATDAAFEDGWLKTGDLGEIGAAGHVFVKGRKKEVIVAADGTKVYPPDVERALNAVPGVRDSAVVGLAQEGQESVHAVVVLADGSDLEQVVAAANAQLDPHQRIRSASRWPGEVLPRTEGTGKLRRVAIGQWASGAGGGVAPEAHDDRLLGVIARYARGRTVGADTTLDDLGLTSLDRVELMVTLEQHFGVPMDERAFAAARSLGDLRRLVDTDAGRTTELAEETDLPRWNTSFPALLAKPILLEGIGLAIARIFAPARVTGLEYLADASGPVLFAANHQSHLDAPAIFAALPVARRYRLAPAMLKERFAVHFHPEGHTRLERWKAGLQYALARLAFAAFPLPQREAGSRAALRHMGWLVSKGYSILVFPEGVRTDAGELRPFRAGVAMMAVRLDLPVVPVRIRGLERVLHKSWNWPRRNRIDVAFGRPIHLAGQDFAALAGEVERAVRAL